MDLKRPHDEGVKRILQFEKSKKPRTLAYPFYMFSQKENVKIIYFHCILYNENSVQ